MVQKSVLFTRILMSAALGVAYVQANAQLLPIGAIAPDFTAKACDGKTHTLSDLTKKGPVYLYFIKGSCPVNTKAFPFFNQLARAYSNKVTFMGVFDGNEKVMGDWEEKLGFNNVYFCFFFDPTRKIIKDYKADRSPELVLIQDGKIAKKWLGYSKSILEDINSTLAKSAKLKAPVKLDFNAAPKNQTEGCPFE